MVIHVLKQDKVMKKTYIIPNMKWAELESEAILIGQSDAAAPTSLFDDVYDGAALSKKQSLWDDEEW